MLAANRFVHRHREEIGRIAFSFWFPFKMKPWNAHGLWQLALVSCKHGRVCEIVTLTDHFFLSFSSTFIIVPDWEGCGMGGGAVSFEPKELAYVPQGHCKYRSKFVSYRLEELVCLTASSIRLPLLPHLTSWQLWQIYLIVVSLGRHFAYFQPFEVYLFNFLSTKLFLRKITNSKY